jgi:uncharacterized membrane protein (UPF0127 family)
MVSRKVRGPLVSGPLPILALGCALYALSALACAEEPRSMPVQRLSIQRADGSVLAVEAEIAADDEDRRRGLMNRKKLDEGKGMLFVFDRDQRLAFWMKDTLIPLSIAFIATDGRILEIRSMEPLDLSPVESERSARYALEVPQGWFGRAGVVLGDRIELPAR